ncbi:TetR/AcrR family transcriptional regulator [Neobacillus sp. OS1-32]|jgi:DNA-binding transcriptional regulator YbjK|uniref:TetR/AcrR family transcriptional regulator n=1 Tax=Neobacillus sp. OS1-32 TaxID=3070682 RepID=UPI0027DF6CD1|nr:TetR/AcrR family transcriptional regulator [Neobacillus sp. OS1-32]WML29638.1 TetR/AcrR family transcriptional regulator [Neobacillus sp. OS1-32]
MPKIVDHDYRKKLIAEATWRVILNEGMEGATVRKIAKEAGLSLGALRHYFSTQNELLVYAMNLVKERATARVMKIVMSELPPKEKVMRVILEIVPVNEETMAEMEVWFAFIFYCKNKRDVFDSHYDGIFPGLCKLFTFLEQHHLLRKDLHKEIEIEKLYAIIDGLALHAMLEPSRVNHERIVKVLTHHLKLICI